MSAAVSIIENQLGNCFVNIHFQANVPMMSAVVHFPPVDPEHAIPEDLPIVRYMKIAAFRMLIEGKVFIPSLKTLQRTDPVEAFLPARIHARYIESHAALHRGEAYRWMLSKVQKWDRDYIDEHEGSLEHFGPILLRTWLKELAIRRSIWCWYAKRTESMGMWNNYGPHGIAIVSSVAGVRAALLLPDDARTSVAKVNYVPGEGLQRHGRLIDPLWINRPYYFKQDAYDYEQEVRFVIASEPVQLVTDGGIVRRVNASLLIGEVLISPHIHLEEAIAIKDVIRRVCPFLGEHQIKISSLLYAGDPKTRMALWHLTKGYEHPSAADMPDRLSSRHEEADHEGVFHALPEMMLQV